MVSGLPSYAMTCPGLKSCPWTWNNRSNLPIGRIGAMSSYARTKKKTVQHLSAAICSSDGAGWVVKGYPNFEETTIVLSTFVRVGACESFL